MHSGRLFWGALLLGLGLLLLVERTGLFRLTWDSAWTWWPIIPVLLGVSMLVRNRPVKGVLIVISALLLAFMLARLFTVGPWCADTRGDLPGENITQEFAEPYDTRVVQSSLRVALTGGEITVRDTTDRLFWSSVSSRAGAFGLMTDRSPGRTTLTLSDKSGWGHGLRTMKTGLDVRLNADPEWNLMFDVGAAELRADLSRFKTPRIELNAGAADITLRVAANVPETRLIIEVGAASVRLEVPEEAGCDIVVDAGLSTEEISGFRKISSGHYRTDNFTTAERRIFASLDAGASDFRVERY
jgi:hypothetical protein